MELRLCVHYTNTNTQRISMSLDWEFDHLNIASSFQKHYILSEFSPCFVLVFF